MIVHGELHEHGHDGVAAFATIRCGDKLLASYSMLEPRNSQVLADRFGYAWRDYAGQSQKMAGPLDPLVLTGVSAWISVLARWLPWPQPARSSIDRRFETSSLPSALLPVELPRLSCL